MNQGKLEVVTQEMARVNIDILGINEPNEQEWMNLIQMTITSTALDKNLLRDGSIRPSYLTPEKPISR